MELLADAFCLGRMRVSKEGKLRTNRRTVIPKSFNCRAGWHQWQTPLIPALGKQRQGKADVQGQCYYRDSSSPDQSHERLQQQKAFKSQCRGPEAVPRPDLLESECVAKLFPNCSHRDFMETQYVSQRQSLRWHGTQGDRERC